jgi:hypothetical protein
MVNIPHSFLAIGMDYFPIKHKCTKESFALRLATQRAFFKKEQKNTDFSACAKVNGK